MKYLLLAKSNIRKTKGLTVGLSLLVTLAACFLNVFLMLNSDFNQNALNIAEELNTEDAYLVINGADVDSVDETYIKSAAGSDMKDFEITEELSLMTELPYADAKVGAQVLIGDEDLFDTKIGHFKVMANDDSIADNYIYLPYQFHTGGGFELGDEFKFTLLDTEYNLIIKGFINTITLGSNNTGAYQLIVDNETYKHMQADSASLIGASLVKFKLADDVDANKFTNKIATTILADYPHSQVISGTLENAIFGRTFLGTIFGVLLLIVCVVVLIIVILMISNNISNFIRENIKTLGALKAIGYTTEDITIAFITQFLIIDFIGTTIGILLSKIVMQLIGDIMVAQSAIPYEAKFVPSTILITAATLFCVVFFLLLFLLRKTKKIEPIVALREGQIDRTIKKNVVPLESSNISLNTDLALKTTFTNFKQNIITGLICFFLVMMSSLSLVMYQNFTVNPKTSVMTFEMCDGLIVTDSDTDSAIYDFIESLDGVENLRMISGNNVNADEVKLVTYILDDTHKLQNREVVYEGTIPEQDNEIVISGKFAQLYGYAIGDDIKISSGENTETFKIAGFMQTLNNGGMEAMLSQASAEKLIGTEYDKSYYFELGDGANLDDIFAEVTAKFGNRTKMTTDYNELAKGALSTFQIIALGVVILVSTINFAIILLVLYMLIKTLINKKKKDYGILKALGFTSKQIIFQNAASFIPSIALSVILASVVSCFVMNDVIGMIMGMFGVMKLNFEIPVLLIAIFGLAFVTLSFILSLLLSRKIKKIEPYKLLIGE